MATKTRTEENSNEVEEATIESPPDHKETKEKEIKKEKKIPMQIYVTPSLKKDIEKNANRLGLTSSGFINFLITNHLNNLS